MHMGDFFREEKYTLPGWNVETTENVLDGDLVRKVRAGPLSDHTDLEVGTALNRLVRTELEKRATDESQQLSEEEIELAQRALKSVLGRLGISLELPWRGFTEFRAYWMERGLTGSGSWQTRRDLIDSFFRPVLSELDRLEDAADRGQLAGAVSPYTDLGWPEVDEEIAELRTRFRSARTAADYRDVGNRSVAVIEALSRLLYKPEQHLREGETEPSTAKTVASVRVVYGTR